MREAHADVQHQLKFKRVRLEIIFSRLALAGDLPAENDVNVLAFQISQLESAEIRLRYEAPLVGRDLRSQAPAHKFRHALCATSTSSILDFASKELQPG